jgi:hypothetical protein
MKLPVGLIGIALTLTGLACPGGAAEIDVVAGVLSATPAPVIDGKVDAVWQGVVPASFVLSEGSQGSVEVRLRAVRTDTHLYLLFQWPDKTESRNRFYEFAGSGWKATRGREDRLNIAWSIDQSVKEFLTKGCSVLCHKTEGVMRTNAPEEKVDLWYWMAQRTNAVGVADDWVVVHEPTRVEGERSGRRPDAPGEGPFEPNWHEAAKRPRFAPKAGVRPGPILLKKDAVEMPATVRFRPGDRLPREVLVPPAGPRAGIEARGLWERGQWTVELRRALVTGDADDVQFTGSGPFYFAVSIHDDAEKDEHAQMGRDMLRLHLR